MSEIISNWLRMCILVLCRLLYYCNIGTPVSSVDGGLRKGSSACKLRVAVNKSIGGLSTTTTLAEVGAE